jgi:uncharacterized membrane protein
MVGKPALFRQAALVLVTALSPFVTHYLLLSDGFGAVAIGLILLQTAIAGWLIWSQMRPPYRYLALLGLAACLFAICLLHRRGGLALASGVPHALIYLGLLAVFGISLLPGHEPIATYFARQIHGPIAPAIIRYTRWATSAWCAFFLLQLLGSAILILAAPIVWWSTFVNILNIPLLLGMFLVERLARPFLLADAPRESVSDMRHMVDLMKGSNPFKRRPSLP